MRNQYNTHTFAALNAMVPPVDIQFLSGRIENLYTPKLGKMDMDPHKMKSGHQLERGILQNGKLRDENSGAVIKFMFADQYLNPAEFEGGFLWLEATDAAPITFKPQKGHPPKIEIKGGAKVRLLVKARDYHGPLGLQAEDAAHSPASEERPSFNHAPFALEKPPAPKAAAFTPASNAPPRKQDPVELVARVAVCARLAVEQVSWALAEAKLADGTIGIKSDSVMLGLANTALVQLLRENAHHAVDLASYDEKWAKPEAPVVPARPQYDILAGHVSVLGEGKITKLMDAMDALPASGKWQDADEKKIAEFLATAAPMLTAPSIHAAA